MPWTPSAEVVGANESAHPVARSTAAPTADKPLLDVGLPVGDLRLLLLLIPLVGIGLMILTVLAGARRGPFDRYHGPGLTVWLEHPQQMLRQLRWRLPTRKG